MSERVRGSRKEVIMSMLRRCLVLVAVFAALSCVSAATANKAADKAAKTPKPAQDATDETKEAADNLAKAPKTVQDAVKKLLGKNALEGFDKEIEEGKTIYEAEYSVKNVTYVFVVAEDGTLIEHGVEVGAFFLPEAVAAAAKKAQPTAKISETAVMVGKGKMYFTVEVKIGQDLRILRIDASGKLISDTSVKTAS
jgi:hypothetical protein